MSGAEIRFSLKQLALIATISSILIGSIYSVGAISYKAGTQKQLIESKIKSINQDAVIKISENKSCISENKNKISNEIIRSKSIDATLSNSINRLDKNLAIQTVLLKEIKDKL